MPTEDNPEKTVLEEELEGGAAADGEEEDSSPEDVEDEEDQEEPGEGSSDEEEDESIPEKFRGKSAADIAKSYTELESQVEKKALEKAQEILANGGVKPQKPGEEDEEEDTLDLSEEEIAKMTPRQFAQWADKRITKKSTEIAQKIINQSNQTRDNVRREIRDVTKDHPHLKTNKSYREMVLDKIEASQARGKTMTLKEACAAVDKAMDIKPGDSKKEGDEKIQKKKPRTTVEKTEGTDAEPDKSDEEKVKEGMLNVEKSTGPLGGLGI